MKYAGFWPGTAAGERWLPGADILWIFALMVYVLVGTPLTPFHGDESTQIMMSRDYHTLFLQGDPAPLQYRDPPLDAAEQHLRLLNGTLPKYLIGLAWHLAGFTVDDLNDQWLWGAGWDWNVANGHKPADALLFAARWPSALLTALSVALLFALALLWGGRRMAYPASFLLAVHPVVLLNGRRAMMEGSLLFFSLLTMLLAAWLGRRLVRASRLSQRDVAEMLALGGAAGLTMASKHSGLVPVLAAYMALAILGFGRSRVRGWRVAVWGLCSVLLAGGVFLALNPAWWSDPVGRGPEVLQLREALVADQVAAFPEAVYRDVPERLGGLVAQLSTAPPAYYEVSDWAAYIADAIQAYQASPWTGILYGINALTTLVGAGVFLLALVGTARLIRQVRTLHPVALVIGLWALLTVLMIVAAVPLAWQRYYMPLYPIEALLAGAGIARLGRAVTVRRRPAPAPGEPRRG